MMKRVVLGLTEPVVLIGIDQEEEVIARVDSGATASSIDLALAKRLKLGPVIKEKVVKSASGVKKRPIITAKVRINGKNIEADFSLADRSHMTYQVLIGQNILKKEKFLIDPLKEVGK